MLRPQDFSDNKRKGKKYSIGLGQHPHKDNALYFSSGYEVRIHYVCISKATHVNEM